MKTSRPQSPAFTPPISWLSRACLWLLLSHEDRRVVLSDLAELYELRCIRDGEPAARAWLRRQMVSFPLRLLADRLLRISLPGLPRDVEGRGDGSEESMSNFFRDLRHSLRSLVRTPALTITILLTVGLGIGSTTVITGVIHSVLLQPLPYHDAQDLVWFYTDAPPNRWRFSVADFQALDEQQTHFSHVAGYANETQTFNRDALAERLTGKSVTWGYFPLLGLKPMLGRLFVQGDDKPGAEPTVVVSHKFWDQYLNRDSNAVGQTIQLDGKGYTLIGVLPADVGPLDQRRDFFLAARWAPPTRKGPFLVNAIGRLKPGADRAAAVEELHAINKRLFPIWKSTYQDEKAVWDIQDLKERLVGNVSVTLVIVLAAVGFLLLITCANSANLLIARANRRRSELAVRTALGASRGRILQHLLSESLLLAVGAALVGVAIAGAGLGLVCTAGADYLPRTAEIGWNASVIWILAGITATSLLVFGLIPAVLGARGSIESTLRQGGRGTTDSAGSRRLQRSLVVLQFAVATPLLIGAGLLIASLAKLQRVDVGIDTHNLITAGVTLPASRYAEEAASVGFLTESMNRIQAIPGVKGVAVMDSRPPEEGNNINNFDLEDKPAGEGGQQSVAPWVAISPKAIDVLGLRLLSGRMLSDADRGENSPPVILVDHAWAQKFFPGEDAVGRRLHEGGCTDCPWTTVVGVVEDARFTGLEHTSIGTVYAPMWQSLGWIIRSNSTLYFTVRTEGEPTSLIPSIRQIVRELDPTLALTDVATGEELVNRALDTPRSLTVLVAAFAAVALMLSLVGVYGVMSYFVQRHTKDIGIRLALGSRPGQVVGLVVKQGMWLVALGLVIGVGLAFWLTRLMASRLYEVGATDPWTFVTVTAGLVATALLACGIPARRASRVDPAMVLHQE